MCWTASPAYRNRAEGIVPAKAEVPPGSYPPSVNLSADEYSTLNMLDQHIEGRIGYLYLSTTCQNLWQGAPFRLPLTIKIMLNSQIIKTQPSQIALFAKNCGKVLPLMQFKILLHKPNINPCQYSCYHQKINPRAY